MPQISKKVVILVDAMSPEKFPIRFGEVNSAWFPGLTRERFLRHSLENRCHELPKLQRVTPAFAQKYFLKNASGKQKKLHTFPEKINK